jgi:diguanylate cyclase (GGDEF)-like protein
MTSDLMGKELLARVRRRRRRMLQGVLVGCGAPLGWLAICWLNDFWDGATLAYQVTVTVYMFLGTVTAFAVFGYVIGGHEGRFARMSMVDNLTGVCNHRYFHEQMEKEFYNAVRYRTPLALLMLDLDHFKQVNDNYGHQSGDLVLTAVAEMIEANVRLGDTVGRVGGEEFAVLMPDTLIEGARSLAERIRQAVADTPVAITGGRHIGVRISVGAACLDPVLDKKAKDLYAVADRALYAAKEAGRDRVVVAERPQGPDYLEFKAQAGDVAEDEAEAE